MKFKKVLATITAATMVMASAMTVCAADQYPNLKYAKENVLVAGDANITNVAGDYSAESVRGVAVLTPFEDVKAGLGLTANQRPTVVVYDAEQKASPDAIVSLESAETDAGATEVASLYFELGAKEDGKWLSKVADTTVKVKVGLPKNADRTKTYSVIRVQENGVVTVLNDLDTSDKTVTFEATSGVGVYGIVTDVTNAAVFAPVAAEEEVTEAEAVEATEVDAEAAEATEVETEAVEATEVDVEDVEAADAE
ncbi:MAG: hypothetical protein K2M91_05650 [Lachnospiraceae bacterium]|nr:hypothetical protein [Lachnospiraceae bacterium]